MLRTSRDRLTDHDGKSLVLFLGPPAEEPDLSPPLSLHLSELDGSDMERLRSLPREHYRHGVHFVLGPGVYEKRPEAVRRFQKLAVAVYWKYVVYPSTSPDIPDEIAVRPEQEFNIMSELRRAENLRLHLRHPLANRLDGLGRGLPMLILLPGPGLAGLGPHLR